MKDAVNHGRKQKPVSEIWRGKESEFALYTSLAGKLHLEAVGSYSTVQGSTHTHARTALPTRWKRPSVVSRTNRRAARLPHIAPRRTLGGETGSSYIHT